MTITEATHTWPVASSSASRSSGHTSSHAGRPLFWQSAVLSVVLSLMPDAFYRFLAVPNGVAMIGLATRCGAALGRSTTMQPLAVTISAARQQSHSDDIR